MDPARMLKRSLRTKLLVLVSIGLISAAAGGSYAAFSNSTASSGNTFSAAASFASCEAYNPSWITGLEHGVVSTAGGGLFDYQQAATADSAVKRTGAYSLRLDSVAGSSSYAAKAMGGSTMVTRFAIRFPTLPTADVALLASTYASSGSNLQLGYRASDQRLTLRYTGSSAASSSTPIAAGSWYVVELKAELGTNPRTGEWRIDGVPQTSVSSSEPAGSNFLVLLGSFVADDVFRVNVDDVVASEAASDYPLGDGRVKALLPDGIASHSNPGNFVQENGAAIDGTSWNRLDDVPMGSGTDSVWQINSSGSSYLGFTFADTNDSCVRAVSAVSAFLSSANQSNNGKTSIFDGSVERMVFSGDMSETALQYKSRIIDPETSPWTQGGVNGLVARVGFSTDVNPFPGWYALLLEYDTATP